MAKKTIDVLVFMEMLLYLIALSTAVSAQQQADPKPLRFDYTAFLGYRTSMSFPVEPHVTGMNPRVVLDATRAMEFRLVCASVRKRTWSKYAGQGKILMFTRKRSRPNLPGNA